MLRLPEFSYVRPGSVDEAVALMAEHGEKCKVVAGGTDLVPNMKHGLFTPEVVIALSGLDELRGVTSGGDGTVTIGAMTTLEDCERNELLCTRLPGLAQAAQAVAGPSQRSMGTLGGNVCLDTRCVWYNQTHFWRKSLGYCLKKDGSVCHVVAKGNRCVAAASNDTGTMLVALDATLRIQSAEGTREVPIREFYHPDGTYNLKLQSHELLTQVVVPAPTEGLHSGYVKLRTRESIDFPKLSVAATYVLGGDGKITDAGLVISAIAAVPRVIRGIAELAQGREPGEELWSELGESALKKVHPLTNIDGDTDYRKEMVPVFTRRAFRAARPSSLS